MKSVLAICGLFLALSATPALADTIDFSNQGFIAASGSGGVTALSNGNVNGNSFNGIPVIAGSVGTLVFSTGSLLGSFEDGGEFSEGALAIQVTGFPAAIFAGNFTGTWSHISGDLFELLGTFSGFWGLVWLASQASFVVNSERSRIRVSDVVGVPTRSCE